MIVPDWILYAWFALAAGSTAYVAWTTSCARTRKRR